MLCHCMYKHYVSSIKFEVLIDPLIYCISLFDFRLLIIIRVLIDPLIKIS